MRHLVIGSLALGAVAVLLLAATPAAQAQYPGYYRYSYSYGYGPQVYPGMSYYSPGGFNYGQGYQGITPRFGLNFGYNTGAWPGYGYGYGWGNTWQPTPGHPPLVRPYPGHPWVNPYRW